MDRLGIYQHIISNLEELVDMVKTLDQAINELMKDYEIKDASKYFKKIRNVKIEMK